MKILNVMGERCHLLGQIDSVEVLVTHLTFVFIDIAGILISIIVSLFMEPWVF